MSTTARAQQHLAANRRHRERQQQREEASAHFGLSPTQRLAAHVLPLDTMAFMTAIAERDGVEIARRHGGEVVKLEKLGFIESTAMNGWRHAIVKLTRDGFAALVSRLRRGASS
jgi:hypothetical protein